MLLFGFNIFCILYFKTGLPSIAENCISSVIDLIILTGLFTLTPYVVQNDLEKKLVLKLEVSRYVTGETSYRNHLFLELVLSKFKKISLREQD